MAHAPNAWTSLPRLLGLIAGVLALAACRPELTAGEWVCNASGGAPSAMPNDPVTVPWSTGFEDRFCDYTERAGFCYEAGNAAYELVTSPVHSGRYAAAFSVNTEGGTVHQQARCVRQGTLPRAAYYGAWYFIPAAAATDGKVWNLFHFQGGADVSDRLHNLWDVSLLEADGGNLSLVVYGPVAQKTLHPDEPTLVPLGSWFHIELFLERAADESGEVTLYQDGERLLSATSLMTDDSTFAQWYVGNYSDGMTPPASTVYVDDISIRGQ